MKKSPAQEVLAKARNRAQVIISIAEIKALETINSAEEKAKNLILTKEDVSHEIKTTVNGKIDAVKADLLHLSNKLNEENEEKVRMSTDIAWIKKAIIGLFTLLGTVGAGLILATVTKLI